LLGGNRHDFRHGRTTRRSVPPTSTNVTLSGAQNAGVVISTAMQTIRLTSETATQSTSTSVGLARRDAFRETRTGTLTMNGMHSFTGNVEVFGGMLKNRAAE
jgi:autotransporter-associated beta strand protein